ncbi:MAG: hypothetical protein ACTSP5_13805 [Candidatus Heimdallarchaeota archaeon]
MSDKYPMFLTLKYLFIIVDCLGGSIVCIAVFLAFYSYRANLKESWKPLIIESALTFAGSFSLQATILHLLFHNNLATILHLLFHNNLAPVSLGLFFISIAFFFFFTALYYSTSYSLFKKYYMLLSPTIIFVSIGTLLSGIYLTFTGSIDQITSSGIGVFSVGLLFIGSLIIVFIFYPKWHRWLVNNN